MTRCLLYLIIVVWNDTAKTLQVQSTQRYTVFAQQIQYIRPMEKRAETYLQIRVDRDLKRQFMERTTRQNVPMARVIKGYMREHIRKVDEAEGKPTDFNA